MRKRFEVQLKLGETAIENVKIPTKSRDELPPVLLGLQWIFKTKEVHEKIFDLLEKKVLSGKEKTGRNGMDLWHILVLGIVRLALDCDYDRLEYLVHHDVLMRQIMGLDILYKGEFGEGFHQKTIQENLCHLDAELIDEINQIIVMEGQGLFKKKRQKSKLKRIHMF